MPPMTTMGPMPTFPSMTTRSPMPLMTTMGPMPTFPSMTTRSPMPPMTTAGPIKENYNWYAGYNK
jgi:hypothetical protein